MKSVPLWKTLLVAVCAIAACFRLLPTLVLSCFLGEKCYNEGWNVYAAKVVSQHHLLYPAHYTWTTVNYPMLSFVVMSALHHLTHDYLFTGRLLSLLSFLASAALVASFVRIGGASRLAATLAGLYCLPLFCYFDQAYIGTFDPQMFAHVLFLSGFFLFLYRRDSYPVLAATALVFVIAACIKHSPVEFPVAVFLELLLVSRLRALWFVVCEIVFAAIAFLANVHFGGPGFALQMLAPRNYFPGKMIHAIFGFRSFHLALLAFVLVVVMYTSILCLQDSRRRPIAILFFVSLVTGSYFFGGHGVNWNVFFTTFFIMAASLGFFWGDTTPGSQPSLRRYHMALPLFLLAVAPMFFNGRWNIVRSVHRAEVAQHHFKDAVAFLESHPGAAICIDLLECAYANKPYIYDGFNATRLIAQGKLDQEVLVQQIQNREFATIEVDPQMLLDPNWGRDLMVQAAFSSMQQNYVVAYQDPNSSIFIPLPDTSRSPATSTTAPSTRSSSLSSPTSAAPPPTPSSPASATAPSAKAPSTAPNSSPSSNKSSSASSPPSTPPSHTPPPDPRSS